MTDEKYTFIEDLREKKKTATGAYHKRTHCGKGGAIRFPSDYMTQKERNAMNGEVKSYKLNDPMSWAEFKTMPDDIKVAYITALRKKYNVSDTKIAEMMGTDQVNLSKEARKLGIKSTRKSKEAWDKDGWYAWVNGVKLEAKEEPVVTLDDGAEMDDAQEKCDAGVPFGAEKCDEEVLEQAEKCDSTPERIVPRIGQMELNGTVEECMNTLQMLLADSRVKLTVAWAVKQDG